MRTEYVPFSASLTEMRLSATNESGREQKKVMATTSVTSAWPATMLPGGAAADASNQPTVAMRLPSAPSPVTEKLYRFAVVLWSKPWPAAFATPSTPTNTSATVTNTTREKLKSRSASLMGKPPLRRAVKAAFRSHSRAEYIAASPEKAISRDRFALENVALRQYGSGERRSRNRNED